MKKITQEIKILTGVLFLLLATMSMSGWGQQIVKPWRASNEIVKSGETFEVWFNANNSQNVNSIELVGPYNKVSPIFTVVNQTWTYDQ